MNASCPFSVRELFEYDLNGFVIIRNFIPLSVVADMNRVIDASPSKECQGKFLYLHLDPMFMELLADARAIMLCEFLLGEWFRLDHAFGIQYGPAPQEGPATGHQGLHAGPYASQGVFRYSWFNNRPQCGLIVFDYFLKHVKKDDGGLVLVPGSHKLNLPLTGHDIFNSVLAGKLDADWLFNPEMGPGDVLIFCEAVIHGTARWKPKNRERRNLHMSYSPGYQASRNPEEMSKVNRLAQTEVQRRLLRPPFALSFDDGGNQLGENRWRERTCIG